MKVAVIGGGQLGMMLGEAAEPLNVDCAFLDPSEAPPAASAGQVFRAGFDDTLALQTLAAECDVLTYEFENVPVEALATLDGTVAIYPPLPALQTAQDRLSEKRLFEQLDIALPGFLAVDSREDLDTAIDTLGTPLVLKTRRFGYDGKGQVVIRTGEDADDAWVSLGGSPLIAEAFVPFDFEVSIIATRAVAGDIAYYPLTENTHVDGILDTSVAPISNDRLQQQAESYVTRLLEHFSYVGTVALELFVCGNDLLANEFAPRVHNSGHWTIEGTDCSQFENHMRAVCGLPLGDPSPRGFSGMKNIVGAMSPGGENYPGFHDYGKSGRPGRKLGHITVVADSEALRDTQLSELSSLFPRPSA